MRPILLSTIEKGFFTWLEAQPADRPCDYWLSTGCPFALYLHDIGYPKAVAGYDYFVFNDTVAENISIFINGEASPHFSKKHDLTNLLMDCSWIKTVGSVRKKINRTREVMQMFSSEMVPGWREG